MEEDGPEPVWITLTCHTSGCENAGIPLTLLTAATVAVCGPCDQPITDITPTKEEA